MRSKNVIRTYVLPTAALMTILTACSDNNQVRNRYASLADCIKDYSKAECEDVEENLDANGNRIPMRSHFFYGPYYHYNSLGTVQSGRTSIGRSFSSSATQAVNSEGAAISAGKVSPSSFSGFARGGFGSTAHGFSSGGFGG